MDAKIHKQLDEAKELFYSWRMVEAYNLMRRFFDRIPFRPEEAHAEHISMFVRILAELGKTRELGFYMTELERHFDKTKSPAVGFVLGVVYFYSDQPRQESARKMFEFIVTSDYQEIYKSKAKMFLANYYDDKNDLASAKKLIDSIPPSGDPKFEILADIWRAKIAKDSHDFEEAKARIENIAKRVSIAEDWYAYFCTKVIYTSLMVEMGQISVAKENLAELKALFAGKHFKSVDLNIESLEKRIAEQTKLAFERKVEDDAISFYFKGNAIPLKEDSPIFVLFEKLLNEKYLSRASIISILYDRNYDPEKDPKLVYYHIHNLRKKLQQIGAPDETILTEEDGYQISPQVTLVDVEN